MIVMKFGGTSVGTADRMKHVASLIKQAGSNVIAVLSAMSGTTNKLVEIAQSYYDKNPDEAKEQIDNLHRKYISEINNLYSTDKWKQKTLEEIGTIIQRLHSFVDDIFTTYEEKIVLAQGELMSTTMMLNYMREQDEQPVLEKPYNATMLYATDFMYIDKNGIPDMVQIKNHLSHLVSQSTEAKIFITQGFVAKNAYNEIDNLKRGGSDYTATLIGAALNAEEIQIWTDIDGMHNADPRLVGNTYPVATLSYDEASELAYFGAKILHPTCVLPSKISNVPIRLKNTMQPEAPGTLITSEQQESKADNKYGVKALAVKGDVCLIGIKPCMDMTMAQLLSQSTSVLNNYDIGCTLVSCAENSLTLCIENNIHLVDALAEIQSFAQTKETHDISVITAVGKIDGNKSEMLLPLFTGLKGANVRMISYGMNSRSISIAVDNAESHAAIKQIADNIFS